VPPRNGARNAFSTLIILAVSVVLCLPTFRRGLPYGMDSSEHLSWYRCFAEQLSSGELYPRWLLGMNAGLGSPDFFVYGPLPYYAAFVFRIFTRGPGRETWELGMSILLAVVFSGVAAYVWLKHLGCTRFAATTAAIIYMSAPYHIKTDLYTRVALAELWAFAWIPLIMYCTARLMRQPSRAVACGLGVSYALLLTTHLFTALMFLPLPFVYVLLMSKPRESLRALRDNLLSLLLGIALSAVYLFPALSWHKYVSAYKLIDTRPDYLYYRNFLFSSDAATSPYLMTTSWLTAWTAAVVAACVLIIILSKKPGIIRETRFWAGVTALSLVLMLPVSGGVWKILPPLQAIQFPSRFNTLVCLALAPVAALAIDSLRGSWDWRKAALAACTLLLIIGWVVPISRSIGYQAGWASQSGTANLDYLITAWAQWTDPKLVTLRGIPPTKGGDAKVVADNASAAIEGWQPRSIQFHITSPAVTWVMVKQFYFPAWAARLTDGGSLEIRPSSPEGLIEIQTPAGDSDIQLRLPYGSAEIAGAIFSLLGVLAAVFLAWPHARRDS
jgi:uncharacterized membrane protein